MTEVTPEAGRRYRRAAVFLIHSRNGGDLGAEGMAEILAEVEREDGPEATGMARFARDLALLAWKMAGQGGEEAAMEYLRRLASDAAFIEVSS